MAMSFVHAIILHVAVAQAHPKEKVRQNSNTQCVIDNLVDRLVDNLLERTLELSSLHQANLDDTTLAKPGHLGNAQRVSSVPLPAYKHHTVHTRPLIHQQATAHTLRAACTFTMASRRTPPSLRASDEAIFPKSELREEWIDTAREAIDFGLKMFEQGDFVKALELFQKSLSLPGTGVKRDRKKPQELSDGEKQAAYFNMACCYSQIAKEYQGKDEEQLKLYNDQALKALDASICEGFDDWSTVSQDKDLKPLRDTEPRFEKFMEYHIKKKSGIENEFWDVRAKQGEWLSPKS